MSITAQSTTVGEPELGRPARAARASRSTGRSRSPGRPATRGRAAAQPRLGGAGSELEDRSGRAARRGGRASSRVERPMAACMASRSRSHAGGAELPISVAAPTVLVRHPRGWRFRAVSSSRPRSGRPPFNVAERGAGDPVVLLHGLLGSPTTWAPLAGWLARARTAWSPSTCPATAAADVLRPVHLRRRRRSSAGPWPSSASSARPCWATPSARRWRSLGGRRPVSALVLRVAGRHRAVLPLRRRGRCCRITGRRRRPPGCGAGGRPRPSIGRRLVFGWFVGMSPAGGRRSAAGPRLLRGAAAAAPRRRACCPRSRHSTSPALPPASAAARWSIWGDRDPHAAGNGAELADGARAASARCCPASVTCR